MIKNQQEELEELRSQTEGGVSNLVKDRFSFSCWGRRLRRTCTSIRKRTDRQRTLMPSLVSISMRSQTPHYYRCERRATSPINYGIMGS
jgi:hypothetical protein